MYFINEFGRSPAQKRGVGSSSGLGLALGPPRPYAASTRPGPGGTALYGGLQSPLTRGRRNRLCQVFYFRHSSLDSARDDGCYAYLLNVSTTQLFPGPPSALSWCPRSHATGLPPCLLGGYPREGSAENAEGGRGRGRNFSPDIFL